MPSFLTDPLEDIGKWFGIGGTTANVTGMNPAATKVATDGATIKNAGVLMSIFGAASSAVGAYYAAKTAQYQQKSQASSLQFQSNIDAINAANQEMQVQGIDQAGRAQVAQYTMRAGQQQAQTQVSQTARGVDLSSASAVEQRASEDLTKQIDVMTINSNTQRAIASARTQETADRNGSLLNNVSASNLTASAKSISPLLSGTTSLVGSAASIASRWDYRRNLVAATAGDS